MALRTAYGNQYSENGWPMVDADSCQWVTVPGTSVSLQIQQGQPLAILRAFAADFNAYVEPLRDADSACWTATNSVATSNHLSGTAMDLNWNSHPFRILNAGFTSQQINTIRDLLDFYEDTVFWGNDWNTPKDAMHFQVGYNTYGNQRTADFIARKIRADGYSTFRRGNAQAPEPSDAVDVLARATGLSGFRAAELLPAIQDGLRLSGCANANRIAMWLAQIGHESGSFQYTEEIAKNGRYAPYIGRTWIQITWDYNYRAFGRWAKSQGLVDDGEFFIKNPKALADLKWAGIGPAWYWTVARPQLNDLSDARDLNSVTLQINGGYNGLSDRQARYNRALTLGDQLLTLAASSTTTDPVLELLMSDLRASSLSIYATPGEPDIPVVELIRAIDAHGSHEEYVERQARLGDRDALSRVARTAAGKGKYGSAAFAVNQARAVLADIEKTNPQLLTNYLKGA